MWTGPYTHAAYEERVARDPLHGLEQEAGQRHPLAAWVRGEFLEEIK